MLKIIGAFCILFSGTMFGFYQAMLLARRPKQIRQLIQALQRLETEILYGFSQLPDAMVSISKPLSEPLANMFRLISRQLIETPDKSTEASWRHAVTEGWRHTAMRTNEQDIVLQLGFTLGITDREEQIKHLKLAVSHLHAEEQTAWDEQKRYEKMWKSLGVLAAALIIVLIY